MRGAIVFLALVATAGAGPLDDEVQKLERRAADRLVALAREALRRKEGATATLLFRRAKSWSPRHPGVARGLGTTPAQRGRAAARRDHDADEVGRLRRRLDTIDRVHAEAVLRACARVAEPEAARPHLLALLAHNPLDGRIHEALGHERAGRFWVRPELAPHLDGMRERLAGWRACRQASRKPVRTEKDYSVAGYAAMLPVFQVEDRLVGSTFSVDATAALASATQSAHDLVGLLLGKPAAFTRYRHAYFLRPEAFAALVHAGHADADERRRLLRYAAYYGRDYVAFRIQSPERGGEDFAHLYAFNVARNLICPLPQPPTQAWVQEGFALLVAFELFGSCRAFTASSRESDGHIGLVHLPPADRSAASCLEWLRGHLRYGSAYPLRDIYGRSLNNLDLMAAVEAWSFLRFLFLLDPLAARQLPGAIRKQTGVPSPERVARALRETFRRDADELEALWRAFTLEIR